MTVNLDPNDEVIIKVRKGTGHVFLIETRRKLCLCKAANRHTDFNGNCYSFRKTVGNVLKNPDNDFIGKLSRNGLSKLEKIV